MAEQEPEYIVFTDDEGKEQQFKVDAYIEMNNHDYVLYSSEGEMLMSRLEHHGEEATLCDVTEEEMEQLVKAYNDAMEEEDAK